MTDDLRRAMRVQAGSAKPPAVDGLWRAGRRRRASRRWVRGAGAAAALLLVAAGVATFVALDDSSETVRAGVAGASCRPRAYPGETILTTDGRFGPQEAPRTTAAMVHGGGSEWLFRPQIVARVKVVTVKEVATPYEGLAGAEPPPEVRAEVEVTDPVFGAEVGDRFTISDAGRAASRADLRAAKKVLTQEIDERQAKVDELNRPLVVLDEQIRRLPPADPAYQDLVDRRSALKERTDPARLALQEQLRDYQQRLQVLQLSERLSSSSPIGTSCHRFRKGDDLVVAVLRPRGASTFELTGPSSFFLVDGDGFSEELDAARRSVPGWTDSELLRLARESTPDEFLDRLRDAADD